ncbi:uncharacterized protein SAPINGB_P002533 [Magnusiomyces paraingens]|uniref:Cas1p 10 TM acyl transferase domain-containing protein n=1 Tax=Magnusiomyces paraingens TaxID=2606893 RepID=A0A5E8BEE3_9ASCO|nr:uncharacterized protein SAPINGB_P002533 [Saprochaete ingens]VVT49965.1 unnamed protein product [Saprochaete ingens]
MKIWNTPHLVFLSTIIFLLISSVLSNVRLRGVYRTGGDRTARCDAILKTGRYLDEPSFGPKQWQPDGCALHKYYQHSSGNPLNPCLLPGDEIIVLGDLSGRQIFDGLANTLEQKDSNEIQSQDRLTTVRSNITVTFLWSPYFNDSSISVIKDISEKGVESEYKKDAKSLVHPNDSTPPRTFLILAGGSLFAQNMGQEGVSMYSNNLNALFDIIRAAKPGAIEPAYFAPIVMPYYSLSPNLNDPASVGSMVSAVDDIFGYRRRSDVSRGSGGILFSTLDSSKPAIYYAPVIQNLGGENHPGHSDASTGMYLSSTARYIASNIFLNHMCNREVAPAHWGNEKEHGTESFSGTCCVEYTGGSGWIVIGGLLLVVVTVYVLFKIHRVNLAIKILPILVAILYVHVAERTPALSTQMLYFDARNMVIFIQIGIFLAFFYRKVDEPLILKNFALSETFISEFKGICVALLILIEFTGYDFQLKSFNGTICAELLKSSWLLLEVYQYTLQLAAKKEFLCGSVGKFIGLKILRLLVLPTLTALVLISPDRLNPQFYVEPLVIRLLFWHLFVTVALLITQILSTQLHFLQQQQQQVHRLGLAILALLGLLTYLFFLPKNQSGDYWLICASVAAAWSSQFANTIQSTTTSVSTSADTSISAGVTTIVSRRFALLGGTCLAMVFNAAYILVPVYIPELIGSQVNHSILECNGAAYSEAIRHRGEAYTPQIHFLLSSVFVISWVLLRAGLGPQTYLGSWILMLGSCAYEAVVLRMHIALTGAGTVALWVVPWGTGHVISGLLERALQKVSADAPYHLFEYPGRLWYETSQVVNGLVVFGIFGVIAYESSRMWREEEEFDEGKKKEKKVFGDKIEGLGV